MGSEIRPSSSGNTSVTSLSVFTSAMTLTAADGISRFIAYSPTIDELNLFTSSHPFNIGDQRRANVDHFLGAATFNGKIAKLDVHQECGVLALINCLRANRGSLRSLTLSFWEGENGLATQQMTEDAETIADAVASLPLLEELSLCDRDDRFFVAPIIDRFIGHPTLTKLCLEHDRTRDEDRDRHSDELRVANAVLDVLRSSTPLSCLQCFVDRNDPNEDGSFRGILHGLHGHKTVRNFTLIVDPTNDQGAASMATMLRHNNSIVDLEMNCFSFVGFSYIVDALGTNTAVEHLQVTVVGLDDEASRIKGHRRLAKLLPRLRNLQCLWLQCLSEPLGVTTSADLMRGFELNTSLTDVHIDWYDDDYDNKASILFYTTRNRYAPSLQRASKAEMLTIFEAVLTHGDVGLSVVFETLRARDDWCGATKGQ